jgi:hypothetical protein
MKALRLEQMLGQGDFVQNGTGGLFWNLEVVASGLGMVVHICRSNYSGGRGKRIENLRTVNKTQPPKKQTKKTASVLGHAYILN